MVNILYFVHPFYLFAQDGQMSSASNMLGATIEKLGLMLEQGGSRHMIYLVVFVVFAFIIVYFIMRSK
jgi:blocked early in transport 1